MKKKRKLKKSVKLIIFVILIFAAVLLIHNIVLKNKLKNIGYTDKQINRFYSFKLDLDLILKYEYCSNIDEILNDSFNKDNLEDYLKDCNNKEEINPPEQKDPFVAELEKQKYYIPDNLERYLAYKDGVKTAEEVVREVNCNIDREFYTNTKQVDLENNNLILVNKYYYLDKSYQPKEAKKLTQNIYSYWSDAVLAKDAQIAFIEMVDDAKELGYSLIDTSAYRSYSTQEYLFNNYIKQNGLEWTLKSSAKPGHSEHQTGLATDIVKVNVSMYDFGTTREFEWLKENAHKYGFILRYPEGKEYLTGYKYEPWHYRYVGLDAAKYIYENDIVFEEYFAYFCEYKKEC